MRAFSFLAVTDFIVHLVNEVDRRVNNFFRTAHRAQRFAFVANARIWSFVSSRLLRQLKRCLQLLLTFLMTFLTTIYAKNIELIFKSAEVLVKGGLFVEAKLLVPGHKQVHVF
jgi:hypothetical protein